MHLVSRLRAPLIALMLLAYLGLQALVLVHEYDGDQHPAGDVCGLCLASAHLDKPLPGAAASPLLPRQTLVPPPAATPSTARAATRFHPARAPPVHA